MSHRMTGRVPLLLLSLSLLLPLLLMAGCGAPAGEQGDRTPASLDDSTTVTSEKGIFRATYRSDLDPVLINELHAWTLHVESAAGVPVEDATITVQGDMPEHRHGMATQPQVTQHLGGGDYRVEGMRFQMGGWWTVTFAITAGDQQDSVTFNLQLQ